VPASFVKISYRSRVLNSGHTTGSSKIFVKFRGRKWLVSIDKDCFSGVPARDGREIAYDRIRELTLRFKSRMLS
jgi:hypothetical protein